MAVARRRVEGTDETVPRRRLPRGQFRLSPLIPLIATLAVVLFLPSAPAQQPAAAPPQQPPTFKAGAQEVVLDVIVRDKKGRAVRDLESREVEVRDAGSPVEVRSFRFVQGADDTGPQAPRAAGETPAVDPLRQIRLVTLVFERLSVNGRRLFRQAALDLINNAQERNLYFSVFYIDQRLHVLQQFTNDRMVLKRAVEQAVAGAYAQYISHSVEIEHTLDAMTRAQQAASDIAADISATHNGSKMSDLGASAAQAELARLQLNSLQFSQANQSVQQARASVFSLIGLVKEQFRLPGRKMLLYFSEDFKVPGDIQEQFRSLISAANRSNVSIYTVDARGLVTTSQNDEGRSLLSQAGEISKREADRYRPGTVNTAVNPDEVRMFDTLMDGLRSNVQAALAELAVSTGGFLISDSNDLRTPLRKALEEVRSYYEIAYTPGIVNYDGRFRPIEVKVKRPDTSVQTRSGYYALPPLSDAPLFPFEIPLLNALTRAPLPRAFEYHAAVQRFDARRSEIEYGVTVEVPVRNLTFALDKEKKMAQLRPSVLILFKSRQGAVVAKMSRDLPREVPEDRMEAFRNGNIVLTYKAKLPPGQYTLETAVADRNAEAVSATKSALVVPASHRGLGISEMVLVRSLETQPEDAADVDPYHFAGGKAVPTLSGALDRSRPLTLYFVVYPEAADASPVQLTIGILQDGKVLGRSNPELPKADGEGRIPFVATLPLSGLSAGQYEIRAIVQQAGAKAAEHTFVTVN